MAQVTAAFFLMAEVAFGVDSAAPLREALTLFNSGKYQQSFDVVTQYLQQAPTSPTAYKLLGMDEYMLGHPREALASVAHATELAPNDADALYYLGRLYFTSDNIPAALTAFQKTVVLDPTNVRAYNYLGQTYEALSQHANAEKAYLRAIELNRDQAKKFEWPDYNLGVLYFNDARNTESVAAFRRALLLNPSFAEAKIKLAGVLSKEHPVAESFELLRQVLDADPGNAEGHYRLALLLTKSGKSEEAREHFEFFQKHRNP